MVVEGDKRGRNYSTWLVMAEMKGTVSGLEINEPTYLPGAAVQLGDVVFESQRCQLDVFDICH